MSQNYSGRAAKLRTKKAQAQAESRQRDYDKLPAKDKFWKENVHTEEDVV